MPITSVAAASVTFSNSGAAANLSQTLVAGEGGATAVLGFNVLAASGGGSKATLWSMDDGVKGDDNPAVAIANKAFAGYDTDLLWQDAANAVETSSKGARFWIDPSGEVKYDASPIASTIAALAAGEVFTDTIQYTIRLGNGTPSVGTLSIAIVGVDDLAVIQPGGSAGTVTEDSATLGSVGGNLQSVDVDGPSDLWSPVSLSGPGHYGSFQMNAAGEWTYQLDNANPAVDARNTGEVLTDSFTVTTADGQSQTVVITINGHTDAVPDPDDHDDRGDPGNNRIVDHAADALIYAGTGNDEVFGNDGEDTIYGGSGDDILHGMAGYDVLYGGSGNDLLLGNAMGDTLVGGLGADTISGSLGADVIVYQSLADGGDTIVDFIHGQDRISLAGIDANGASGGDQAFAWGGAAPTANGLWFQFDGTVTHVYADANGDLAADFEILLTGNLALTAADFVL